MTGRLSSASSVSMNMLLACVTGSISLTSPFCFFWPFFFFFFVFPFFDACCWSMLYACLRGFGSTEAARLASSVVRLANWRLVSTELMQRAIPSRTIACAALRPSSRSMAWAATSRDIAH